MQKYRIFAKVDGQLKLVKQGEAGHEPHIRLLVRKIVRRFPLAEGSIIVIDLAGDSLAYEVQAFEYLQAIEVPKEAAIHV